MLDINVSCHMPIRKAELQSIYLSKMTESAARLRAAQSFLAMHTVSDAVPELDAAILQVRKALESIALASVAPNKSKYESFRAKASEQTDYTKDYHAGRIFQVLNKINRNFYPLPLLPATQQPDGTFHFGRKASGYLTKKRFQSFYDRLGKHLHADNPWGHSKNLQNLTADLPDVIGEAFSLLELHVTFIQTPEFSGAWVVEVSRSGAAPRVITGEAAGEFGIADS